MGETPSSPTVSTKLERVAELARKMKGVPFTTFAHHIDVDWLYEAYRRTRKDGASGIDEQSAKQYAKALGENLRGLCERAKSGRYRAPPVRRVLCFAIIGPRHRTDATREIPLAAEGGNQCMTSFRDIAEPCQ